MTTHIDGGASQVPPDKWRLVLDWCLVALQGSADGLSILNLGSSAPALCQDNEFLEWCKLCLAATLGNDRRQLAPLGAREERDNLHLVERITSNMGRSFMAGVQALAPTIAGAARQGGSYDRDSGGNGMGGKLYSENNVATLKGYCGVVDPANIPTIWELFQQTREIAAHRHNIRVAMIKWAKQTGKETNKGPFFTEQTTIKDIVGLNFNLGKAVPTYAYVQQGISILTCRPKTAQEVETIKDFEEACRATVHTAQFNEVRRCQKTPPSPPSDTYFELRLSVNTFCALVWMLFGDKCDYYKSLFKICETLDLQEVHIIWELFTADVCCRIAWVILSNGHSFFNTVLVEAQFRRGERFKWPTSLIQKITDDVQFAKTIERPFYPMEWLILMAGGPGPAGAGEAGGGYGGGQVPSRTRDSAKGSTPKRREHGGGAGNCHQPWVNDRHPKIVAMMADYVANHGLWVHLTEILDAANKQITDLPTIPEYMNNGHPFICWAHVLGWCSFANCAFCNGHVPRSNIPDAFGDAVVAMLTPGVKKCVQARGQGRIPGEHIKGKPT